MLPITIHFDTGKETHQLPTSWQDVPWRNFVALINAKESNELETISLLTGISLQTLAMLPSHVMIGIANALAFVAVPPTPTVPEDLKDFTIGDKPWKLLEQARQLLKTNGEKHIYNVGEAIVKIYTKQNIGEQPTTQAVDKVDFFLRRSMLSLCSSVYFRLGSPKLMKCRQVLTALKNMASLPHWMPLPRATHLNITHSSRWMPKLYTPSYS